MRSFAEKRKSTRQTASTKPPTPSREHLGHSPEANSILHLQRTIGNQAVHRLFDRAETRKADSTVTGFPRSGHDFSRIPIITSTAGKPATPLADEEPWMEISGNGGPKAKPGAKPDAGAPAGGGAAAATSPKLTKKTVSAPTASDCGGFKWVIQWELDKKTTKGGWVVQKVELPYNVKDCSNKAFDPRKGGLQPGWYPVWEAWQIHKDQQVTTYAEKGDVKDDTYGTPGPGSDTKGSVTVKGTAEFYDGLTLPSSFKVTNKAPGYILPTTTSASTLSGGTGSISHTLKATWDCCSKDKAATKTTKVDTT